MFCRIDDFCNELDEYSSHQFIGEFSHKRGPEIRLSLSEIMTLLIGFQTLRSLAKITYTIMVESNSSILGENHLCAAWFFSFLLCWPQCPFDKCLVSHSKKRAGYLSSTKKALLKSFFDDVRKRSHLIFFCYPVMNVMINIHKQFFRCLTNSHERILCFSPCVTHCVEANVTIACLPSCA